MSKLLMEKMAGYYEDMYPYDEAKESSRIQRELSDYTEKNPYKWRKEVPKSSGIKSIAIPGALGAAAGIALGLTEKGKNRKKMLLEAPLAMSFLGAGSGFAARDAIHQHRVKKENTPEKIQGRKNQYISEETPKKLSESRAKYLDDASYANEHLKTFGSKNIEHLKPYLEQEHSDKGRAYVIGQLGNSGNLDGVKAGAKLLQKPGHWHTSGWGGDPYVLDDKAKRVFSVRENKYLDDFEDKNGYDPYEALRTGAY